MHKASIKITQHSYNEVVISFLVIILSGNKVPPYLEKWKSKSERVLVPELLPSLPHVIDKNN